MKWIILFSACLTASAACADIYKSVDANGQVTYTDHPIKGAHRLNLGPMPAATRTVRINGERKILPAVNNGSGSGAFRRIDAGTQHKRDKIRHDILQGELNSEEQALTESEAAKHSGEKLNRGELPNSPAYLSRLEKLDEAIKLHRDNITALQKELGNLK